MLGLRLTKGISIPDFISRFNVHPFEVFDLERFVDMGLLEIEEDYLKTTSKGMDVLDEILIDM